jgi:hypothetical protein
MLRKEKKCKNPECDSSIQYYENPKKLFCDLTCKNRYHYLKDLHENAEIISFENSLRKNYKYIVDLIDRCIYVVDADLARAMGFNRRIYMDLFKRFPGEKNSRSLKRIKDVYFVFDMLDNRIYLFDSKSIKPFT